MNDDRTPEERKQTAEMLKALFSTVTTANSGFELPPEYDEAAGWKLSFEPNCLPPGTSLPVTISRDGTRPDKLDWVECRWAAIPTQKFSPGEKPVIKGYQTSGRAAAWFDVKTGNLHVERAPLFKLSRYVNYTTGPSNPGT